MVRVLSTSERPKRSFEMKIREIDLQTMVMLRLDGKLDKTSVQEIAAKTRALLKNNCLKIVLDMERVRADNQSLIFLAAFLNDFKRKKGSVKLYPAQNQGFVKIELYMLPLNIPISGYSHYYH
jgi:ABC-type transporter Mla MlaB component